MSKKTLNSKNHEAHGTNRFAGLLIKVTPPVYGAGCVRQSAHNVIAPRVGSLFRFAPISYGDIGSGGRARSAPFMPLKLNDYSLRFFHRLRMCKCLCHCLCIGARVFSLRELLSIFGCSDFHRNDTSDQRVRLTFVSAEAWEFSGALEVILIRPATGLRFSLELPRRF